MPNLSQPPLNVADLQTRVWYDWFFQVFKNITDSGSWTPTVDFDTTGDFSPTYNSQSGIWNKVGNLIFISCNLNFDTNAYTTASGNLKIEGIPFTASSESTQVFPAVLSGVNTDNTAVHVTAEITPNTKTVLLRHTRDNLTTNEITTTHIAASSTFGINFSGVYRQE